MRSSRAIAAVVLAVIVGSGWASAATKSATERVRQPLGNNPHPVIWSSTRPRPATPPPQSRSATPARNPRHSNSQRDAYRGYDGYDYDSFRDRPGVYVPYYWYFYPYSAYGDWPPWYAFGIGGAEQDVSQSERTEDVRQPWPNGVAAVADPPFAADPPEPKARADRAVNAHSNELAWKYIGYGDALFAKQKYAEANDRYRKAARSAPQLAAALFRQGFALAAIGRCDMAAAAIKHGLKLDPAWPQSNFDIDQLFGGNAAAKNARLDALAAAVNDKPADPDCLFVLGVLLHFDGQAQRAAPLFERAEQIVGNNIGHIEAFLR